MTSPSTPGNTSTEVILLLASNPHNRRRSTERQPLANLSKSVPSRPRIQGDAHGTLLPMGVSINSTASWQHKHIAGSTVRIEQMKQ